MGGTLDVKKIWERGMELFLIAAPQDSSLRYPAAEST
jgi:hypothetical protein